MLRQVEDGAGALQAYSSLEQLSSVIVGGQPADIVGRQGRCRVLAEARDVEGLRTEAVRLAEALDSIHWPIDQATFDLYREMVQGWGAPPPSRKALARVEAANKLRRARSGGQLAPRGRRIFRVEEAPVIAVWAGGPNNPTAWIDALEEFAASLRPLWIGQQLAVSLYNSDGQRVFGEARPGAVSLTPGDTRLPFIVSVASVATERGSGSVVLITGLALAF